MMTRDQAAAAAAALVAERDAVQANLLELDASFGKQLLAGAALAGVTADRWAQAQAQLAQVWQVFGGYSAAADSAAQLAAGLHRQTSVKLAQLEELLHGRPVQLTEPPAPPGRRELTAGATRSVGLATAVAEMRRGYQAVADVYAAAEAVFTQVTERVQPVAAALATARAQAAGVADPELSAALAAADDDLARLRARVAADPLSMWRDGQADMSEAAGLAARAGAVAAQAAELDALKTGADQRIAALESAVGAARAAWSDALAARQHAASRIAGTGGALAPPDLGALARQAAGMPALRGRWGALAAQLDQAEEAAADATRAGRAAEQEARELLARRDELRGLLDAYRAKAMSLGAAEDLDLGTLHQAARDLLWTAPCDLAAAQSAVRGYQQAVLALSRKRAG